MSKTICVFCSSSNKIAPIYFDAAKTLGQTIASAGWKCVNGGGNRGLMREVSDAALSQGGHVVGVAPQFMVEEGWVHQQLSEFHVTETMHERKMLMSKLSDAVVALPGGVGTFDELFEIITWKQLGLFHGQIVILNTNGYYDKMLEMLEMAASENFIGDFHQSIWFVANTPTEAIEYIKKEEKWIESPRSVAALG